MAVGLSVLLSIGVAALVAGWIIAESVFPIGPGSALGGSLVVSPPHHAARSLHGTHPRFANAIAGPAAVTGASSSESVTPSAAGPGSSSRGHCRICQRVKATGLFKSHPRKAVAHALRTLARETAHGGGNGHDKANGHDGDHGSGHDHDKDKSNGNGHSASRPPSHGWLLHLIHYVRHRHHH